MTVQTKANIAAGAFLAACLLPAAGMFLPERPAAANQALAPPPSFTRPDGSWNPALLQEVSDYIADHFGFRQELITAEVFLRMKPEKAERVKFDTIDGQKYLMIPMEEDEHVNLNGVEK